MKKFWIILIALSFLTSNAYAQFSFTFGDSEPEYTASEYLTSIYLSQTVQVLSIGDGIGMCSGTVIYEDLDNQYILTAKHCIDITEEMYVEDNAVISIMTSVDDDLAILKLDGKISNKRVAKLAYLNAVNGEIVHHIGYPSGILYKASGKITKQTKDWQFADFRSIGGCSGGAVFNDRGDLVGVLWGGFTFAKDDAPLKTIFEPAEDIREFLKAVLPKAL